ncbi:hypothetical protein CLU79DRAFT_841395, partial [Phycomyces nitens]
MLRKMLLRIKKYCVILPNFPSILTNTANNYASITYHAPSRLRSKLSIKLTSLSTHCPSFSPNERHLFSPIPDVILIDAPIPGASNELMSFLASMLTRLDNTEKLADQVKALEAENSRLQAELAETRKRLEQATTSQTSLPLGNSPNVSTSDHAPNPSSQEPGLEASTWAAKASVNRPPPARKGPSPRRVAASQLRSSLRTLGIDTARLLDINFPARGIIGILVHLQFVEEFEAQLDRAKYHDLSLDKRANAAIQVQNARCLQTLKFLHPMLPS